VLRGAAQRTVRNLKDEGKGQRSDRGDSKGSQKSERRGCVVFLKIYCHDGGTRAKRGLTSEKTVKKEKVEVLTDKESNRSFQKREFSARLSMFSTVKIEGDWRVETVSRQKEAACGGAKSNNSESLNPENPHGEGES